MKTIISLAKSRIKFNKSRTLLTSIAIMLTTTLLMGLATSALGLYDMQKQQAAAANNVHATFKQLTPEQLDILKNHADVEAMNAQCIVSTLENVDFQGFLTYGKNIKEGIYNGRGNVVDGALPEKIDDICGPPSFFEMCGAEPKVGNKISLDLRVNGEGKIITQEFTICGVTDEVDLDKLKNISRDRLTYGAQVSEAWLDKYIPTDERSFGVQLRVYGEDELSYDEMEAKINALAADVGCLASNITLNKQYLGTTTDPNTEMISIVLLIALVIAVFSGLVIYSIYYVGIITDVQEIGKLKALGATKKQIKRLMLSEGMRISAIAIPLGLLLGYIIPYFAFPVIMNKLADSIATAYEIEKLHMFSLPLLIAVALAVLIIIYISLLKPMRMAGKISPVEAIRYQESSRGKKLRKGAKNVSLFGLSKANLTRNKRRTAVTMITMGLSCVLFMSLAGVMNSTQSEDIAARNIPKGDFRITMDYSYDDKEYPENNLYNLQKQDYFGEELTSKIEAIDGVEKIEKNGKLQITGDQSFYRFQEDPGSSISYFTRENAEELKKNLAGGSLDYDKMTAENGILYAAAITMAEDGLAIGDTIPITIYDGDREIQTEVTIMAAVETLDDISDNEAEFMMTEDTYKSLGITTPATTDMYISVDDKKYDEIKPQLKEIAAANDHFRLNSMDEEMEIGDMSVNMIKYPVYVILILIAVIGFLNLINTMITSIVTRKRELGMLQAIGLSNRQLTKMLSREGMVFTAGTLILSLTLGNIFGYLVFLWAKADHFMSISTYHYPVWETVGLAAALIIGQFFITRFISKRVQKQSLIDRIRSGE